MAPAAVKDGRVVLALALGALLVACAAVGAAAADEQSVAKGLQDFMSAAQQAPKEGGKDLRQYYISAKKDMGVTHCALQGVLRNSSAPRNEDSDARCATFEPFEYKGQLVTVHLFMKMIVRDAIAYVRGYAVVEMVGHHNLAWHFLGNAAASNDLWSHEISLGSSRTNTIYGPIKVFNATGEFSKYFELAPIHLKPEDAVNPELEVYSEHLGYACYLLPAKESSLKTILGKVQRPSRTVEVDDEPAERNSLFMLAPFFNIPAEVVARLLHWSIRWHEQFSVDAYVLYVQRDLQVFLELPEVQMLIERGRLVVVHWDVLPTLVTPTFLGPEPKTTCLQYIGYWHKLIIYNHFFAAMWMENVHVFMADYDEWLVTKKPMTISQIMEECTGGGDAGVMASVELRRRISSCLSCGETLERDLWTGRDPAGPMDQHPVLEYSVGPIDNKPKTLFNPEYIMAVGAHAGTPVNGSTAFSVPDTTCAFVLHMFKMMVDRHYPHDKFAAMKLTQDELWPLRSATSESKAMRRVSRQLKLW